MTVALGEFLLARIAEDERAADRFFEDDERGPGSWHAHIRADLRGKRVLLAEHGDAHWFNNEDYNPPREGCYICDDICRLSRLAALPYADHPDYRQEWKL